jgi:hypothetical protein
MPSLEIIQRVETLRVRYMKPFLTCEPEKVIAGGDYRVTFGRA